MVPIQDMSGCEETKSRKAAFGMSWEDYKTLIREEFCPVNEMQKLETESWNHAMVGAGHATYTNRFSELARNGSLKRNLEKKGNGREPNRDRNARDENKRTRTRNAFTTTTNPIRREYNGTIPKCVSCNLHHPPELPFRDCFNCGRPRHIANDCKVAPRIVNPVNARNPIAAPGACYECRGINHFKVACPRLNQAKRVFILGAEEARQDSNIMTGIEPSELGFSYEIKIASGQLVEIGKVIRGCKLETEGHMFDISLILFGSGSFDMIIRMDWFSTIRMK
nr:hypothetical protein [Tanacetum cinerariifolium]